MNDDKRESIRLAIQKKYASISKSALEEFNYQTGKAGTEMLNYDSTIVSHIPIETLNCFCGVGNPFSIGAINNGEAVLDIGSGAGVDLVVASFLVGKDGKVCGVDLTPEMVNKTKETVEKMGISNIDVQVGSSEELPFAAESFDVVISNGVLNLSPLKEKTFREIYRVLKHGGRLQFADITQKNTYLKEEANNIELWSN